MIQWLGLGIGSLGLVVASISLLWQIHTHRQARTESVEARLSFDINQQGHFLCVTVVNTCERPLYIKGVDLVFKHIEKEQVTPQGHRSTPVATTLNFTPRGTEGPLAPGDSRVYALLEEFARKMFGAVSPDHLEDIRVSVKTAKGEVCRIPREDVVPFFRDDEEKAPTTAST